MTATSLPFLRVLQGLPVDYTPIWIMRQAGRYLPEYRATREKAGSFLNLCRTPELATEVTLQPLRRFSLDASIIFSDILTIPHAMGLGLHFVEGQGPVFETPITQLAQIDNLKIPNVDDELGYVFDAVKMVKAEIEGKTPLIGFCGSPFTVATYMLEGGTSKTFAQTKKLLYQHPEYLHQLLQKLTDISIDYLAGQVNAGADAIMIFDTWGGILTPLGYEQFSLAYMQQMVEKLQMRFEDSTPPIILFTKNGGQWLDKMANSGCQALGVDWTIDLKDARAKVGDKVALQGNLEPTVLYADTASIEQEVKKVLASAGVGHQHIFNLGHGILPDVPPENVAALIDAVRTHSPQYHQ